MKNVRRVVYPILMWTAFVPAARAQQADSVPKGLSGSAGFGLSLTQGNSDTLNVNATVDSIYDPKTKNLVKWNALYLRGKQNGVLSLNRVFGSVRDEFTVSKRVFLFGQFDALHDTFKGVDYLYAPTVGAGYKVIDSKRTTFDVSGGVGGVVEKDIGQDALGNGAVTFGEKLVHQLTDTTTLREAATGLVKMGDAGNGLYTFGVGAAARVNSRLQLAVDLLDTFKNQPVDGLTHKHDLALVTSIVAKY